MRLKQLDITDSFMCEGACVNSKNPDDWFPEPKRGSGGTIIAWRKTEEGKRASNICSSCPVATACLNYALQYHDLSGVWGGLDDRERSTIQDNAGITTKTIMGASAEYVRHETRGRNG